MSSVTSEVHATAQRWFARLLAPDCSESDRVEFARWRAAELAHEAAYRQVEEIWSRSANLREDPAIALALGEALRPVRRQRQTWNFSWLALGATAAVVLVAASASWMLLVDSGTTTRYATAMGEERTVILEDGSHVVLDTNTTLLAHFTKRERDLRLEHGRADFAVSHNAEWPFVVHTPDGSVTATGTRFQVRVGDGASTVTLLQGGVRVATVDEARSVVLAPDETTTVTSTGALGIPRPVSSTDLSTLQGWTQGTLVVKGWPLAMVLEEMNRYSSTKLRMEDTSLSDISISGVFKPGDQKSFATALEYGWPIRAHLRPAENEIVLTRR